MSVTAPGAGDATVMRPTVVEVSLARLTENLGAIETAVAPAAVMPIVKANAYGHGLVEVARHLVTQGARRLGVLDQAVAVGVGLDDRSEEHTSELQSRFDLVCRLLLEKKK